ncbi:vacuolar ATP synthase 16 kda proteolipid subunit [Colletotrichum plurivorum]|uniref:V-type proton ATPase proteolipid subunit n=1 Tax=Colletotrichum plurivorum TaxID=2175906 RepID=A0A8H6KYV7_9PEZI|nr:vacuolar ATP synthase 16 kda proteolipid subunit [Colletotrichum plurivorum]
MSYNYDRCPEYSPFFGAMGCCIAIIFTVFGAAYGTAKSSASIFASGVLRPERLMQNMICAIMAQILSIYGLVVAVIISGKLVEEGMALHTAFLLLGAGLSVGLCGLAAGFAIGVIGDSGGKSFLFSDPRPRVRASTQQPRLYVGMILILIFAEVLGLYGTIIAIMMVSNSVPNCAVPS